jgi:hypothetical protein
MPGGDPPPGTFFAGELPPTPSPGPLQGGGLEAALGPTLHIARFALLVLALGLAPAAGALPLEKDPAEAPPAVREPAAAPTPPPASHVRSALVSGHLPARAFPAAQRPLHPIGGNEVRIRFETARPQPISLDVGLLTGVADGLLMPRPDFLMPHVAAPADDGIERLRPLAQR